VRASACIRGKRPKSYDGFDDVRTCDRNGNTDTLDRFRRSCSGFPLYRATTTTVSMSLPEGSPKRRSRRRLGPLNTCNWAASMSMFFFSFSRVNTFLNRPSRLGSAQILWALASLLSTSLSFSLPSRVILQFPELENPSYYHPSLPSTCWPSTDSVHPGHLVQVLVFPSRTPSEHISQGSYSYSNNLTNNTSHPTHSWQLALHWRPSSYPEVWHSATPRRRGSSPATTSSAITLPGLVEGLPARHRCGQWVQQQFVPCRLQPVLPRRVPGI
jgi:hypothetical protein